MVSPDPNPHRQQAFQPARARLADCLITLALWVYFTLGFLVGFAPRYLYARLTAREVAVEFQRLNHDFYRGLFGLLRVLVPAHRWQIDPGVRSLRSRVIVCNHVSYMDPILLISLLPRHSTIAKSRLFRIPMFGRMLELSGYLPSSAEGRLAQVLMERMEAMGEALSAGGNLFVFPEGTRTRTGAVGRLNKGAFKIARRLRVPIVVLAIRNTDRIFAPGRFWFNTRHPVTVSVRVLAEISPEAEGQGASIEHLSARVHSLFVREMESIDLQGSIQTSGLNSDLSRENG